MDLVFNARLLGQVDLVILLFWILEMDTHIYQWRDVNVFVK